jgi:HAMP domain-containing protein
MEDNKQIVSEAPKGADAPKAGAGKAEPMQKAADYEDGGKAVTSPTDASSTDHAKKAKKDSSAPTKGATPAEPMSKLNAEDEKEHDKVKKEEAEAVAEADEKEKEDDKEDEKEIMEMPKTKAGMIQAMYDMMNKKKKSEIAASYGKMMAAMNGDHEDSKDEAMHDDEKSKEKKEAVEKRVRDIDVKEDVEALVSGDETLSETFKDKAATIFEAAVKSKVRNEIERLEDEFGAELSEAKETYKQDLTNKVDNYLNYVVEEWMKENELAIEKGVKGEIAEDFISGLKQLFEDHYIDVPEEKYDVLGAKEDEIEELKGKINEMTEKSVEMKQQINEFSKDEILEEVTAGLADTEVEKLKSLIEDVSYEGAEQYKAKLTTIKEGYFGAAKQAPASTENVDTTNSNDGNTVTEVSDSMSRYTDAISRVKSRDIYGNK